MTSPSGPNAAQTLIPPELWSLIKAPSDAPASTQVTRPLPGSGSVPRHDWILSADANIWTPQPRLGRFDPPGSQLLSRCLFMASVNPPVPLLFPPRRFHPCAHVDHQKRGRRHWPASAERPHHRTVPGGSGRRRQPAAMFMLAVGVLWDGGGGGLSCVAANPPRPR